MRRVLRVFGIARANRNDEIASARVNAAKIVRDRAARKRKRRPCRPCWPPFAFGVEAGRGFYEVPEKHFAVSALVSARFCERMWAKRALC